MGLVVIADTLRVVIMPQALGLQFQLLTLERNSEFALDSAGDRLLSAWSYSVHNSTN